MRLVANAHEGARRVMIAFPDAIFTSGRRDMATQARVMANNVCLVGPDWLDIYGGKWARIVKTLKIHVSENPEQLKDKAKLALEFYDIFNQYFKKELASFPHIVGRAFDIKWPRRADGSLDKPKWEDLCRFIEELPIELGLEKLLRQEGNVEVIHAQFSAAFEEVKI